MDLKQKLRFYSVAIAVVTYSTISATVSTALNTVPIVFAQLKQNFMAKLTGQNEVPLKNTNATGSFELQLAPGVPSAYVLNLTNISNVTLVHIHQGANGENGPIIVTIYKNANPGGQINGTFLKGKFLGNQFEGPLAGKYVSDLMKLINGGNAYVNVHTKQNPQGEIRGQLIRS